MSLTPKENLARIEELRNTSPSAALHGWKWRVTTYLAVAASALALTGIGYGVYNQEQQTAATICQSTVNNTFRQNLTSTTDPDRLDRAASDLYATRIAEILEGKATVSATQALADYRATRAADDEARAATPITTSKGTCP